jgi:hypothetical protein
LISNPLGRRVPPKRASAGREREGTNLEGVDLTLGGPEHHTLEDGLELVCGMNHKAERGKWANRI